MEPEAAGPEGGNAPPVSTTEGRHHPRRRAWRWPVLGLAVWMLVGVLGLMVLDGGSSSSMGVFIFGPLIRGVASIWMGGLLVLLVWLLVAAISAEPPARVVAAIAAVGLAGAIAVDLSMMGATAAPSSSGGVPPVGDIWFGGVYDPDTHAFSGCPRYVITGCEIDVNKDQLVRLVAHVPRAEREAVVIHWGDDTSDHFDQVPANGEFLEMSIGPFFDPGFTAVVVTDVDGNVLALGGLTVLDQ